MGKPSFPWYPDDWMNDLGLRSCSLATRAIWIDLICMMHQGVPYGHLADASGPLPIKLVASRCHATVKQLGTAILELETHNVFSRSETGVIFSRRMVRDERVRQARALGGPRSLQNPAVPQPKDPLNHAHRFGSKDTFDPVNVKDKVTQFNETNGSEQTKNDLIPFFAAEQFFSLWWAIWSATRGTNHMIEAQNAYGTYVTSSEIHEALVECTVSYLASLDKPNTGYNPENFIMFQSRQKFTARWPPARAPNRGREAAIARGLLTRLIKQGESDGDPKRE